MSCIAAQGPTVLKTAPREIVRALRDVQQEPCRPPRSLHTTQFYNHKPHSFGIMLCLATDVGGSVDMLQPEREKEEQKHPLNSKATILKRHTGFKSITLVQLLCISE